MIHLIIYPPITYYDIWTAECCIIIHTLALNFSYKNMNKLKVF